MNPRRRISTVFRKPAAVAALAGCLTFQVPVETPAGTYGTELPFAAGTGGRASAMGLAATSLDGGPSIQHFNPAGLAGIQYKHIEFYRTTFFDSESAYHTFHYGHPVLDYGAFGISVLRLDVGGIERRDENNILLDGDLKNAQTRLLLGYAASLHSALAMGINLKVDNQSFGDFNGSGIGMDVGVRATHSFAAESSLEYVRGGFAVQNLIEPTVKLDEEDVADPLAVVFGASGSATAGEIGFVTAVDVVAPRFSPYRFRFGQEVSYAKKLAFRFGFDGGTPTFGLGAAWRLVSVHYAYREEDLGSNHRISVSVRFGSSLDEQRESRRAALEAELDRQINDKLSDLESSQLSETLRRADALYAGARYREAATQYELALLWDEENERARRQVTICRYYDEMQQAVTLMESADHLEALYHLRQALRYAPGDPEATAQMTECNRRIRAEKDHTDMIDRMLKHSIDLYASRRFVESRDGFREILRLDPDNALAAEYERKADTNIQNRVQALIVEANALAGRGSFEAAVNAIEEAMRLAPADQSLAGRIEAIERRARAKADARDRAPAVSAPPSTTTYDPTTLEPKYNEGLRYFDQGRYATAVRRFHEVWAIAPDYHNVSDLLTKTYLFLGMEEYSAENYREAIVIWEKALTVDPDNAKARRYLIKAREEASRLSKVENG